MPTESNLYVSPAPVPAPTPAKNTLDSVKDVLGKWGKKAVEATKKAKDLAGNMWQHLKTGPSFADADVGRISQGTKVLAEGGYEKIFRQTFETVPEEQHRENHSVKDVLGKWGKKAAEATKKAKDLAGNMWQHLKTGPSFADADVGRIAQGTKVLAK
ncbi:hypothetical protein RYX36_008521, partial [Vicia faba]